MSSLIFTRDLHCCPLPDNLARYVEAKLAQTYADEDQQRPSTTSVTALISQSDRLPPAPLHTHSIRERSTLTGIAGFLFKTVLNTDVTGRIC